VYLTNTKISYVIYTNLLFVLWLLLVMNLLDDGKKKSVVNVFQCFLVLRQVELKSSLMTCRCRRLMLGCAW